MFEHICKVENIWLEYIKNDSIKKISHVKLKRDGLEHINMTFNKISYVSMYKVEKGCNSLPNVLKLRNNISNINFNKNIKGTCICIVENRWLQYIKYDFQ